MKYLLLFLCFTALGGEGLTFYANWDEEAKTACATALIRIQKPFATLTPNLKIVGNDIALTSAVNIRHFPSLKGVSEQIKSHFSTSSKPLPIGKYLPKIVREPALLDKQGDANCLGASMAWYGLIEGSFFLDLFTFRKLLGEHFDEVKRGDKLLPETLMVWWYPGENRVIHSAILLDRDTVWHRAGGRNPSGYDYIGKPINSYGGRNGGTDDARITFYRQIPSSQYNSARSHR